MAETTLDDAQYFHHLRHAVQHFLLGSGTLKNRIKNAMVSHLMIFPVKLGDPGVAGYIADAVRLATCTESPYPLTSPLDYTLAMNHWSLNKRIVELIWQAYEIAAEAHLLQQDHFNRKSTP